jgi:hypothetical protein
MRMPCNFHTQGAWMVCPDLDSQVCILDREHKVVAQLGDGKAENGDVGSRRSQSRAQFTPGKFITPHDAIFCTVATFWLLSGCRSEGSLFCAGLRRLRMYRRGCRLRTGAARELSKNDLADQAFGHGFAR